MSARSRNKGHGFEREIARLLRPLFPQCKRKLEYQSQEAQGVDLDGTGQLVIQCKRSRKSIPLAAINEIKVAGIKVLVSKVDHEPIYATLQLSDLIRILGGEINVKS